MGRMIRWHVLLLSCPWMPPVAFMEVVLDDNFMCYMPIHFVAQKRAKRGKRAVRKKNKTTTTSFWPKWGRCDKMVSQPVRFVFSLRSRSRGSIRKTMCRERDQSHVGYVSAFLRGLGGTSCSHLEPCQTQQKQTKIVPFIHSVFKWKPPASYDSLLKKQSFVPVLQASISMNVFSFLSGFEYKKGLSVDSKPPSGGGLVNQAITPI